MVLGIEVWLVHPTLLSPSISWSFLSGCPYRLVQLALIAPVEEEKWARYSRTPVLDMGLESEVVLWPSLLVEEAIRRLARDRSECSGRRGGSESEGGSHSSSTKPSGQWLDHPPGLSFRYLGRPMSCALFAWAEPLLETQSARDPGFMNPIILLF